MSTNTYSPQKQAYINIEKVLRAFPGRTGKTITIVAHSSDGDIRTRLGYARLDRGVVRMMSDTKWASRFPNQDRAAQGPDGPLTEPDLNRFVEMYQSLLREVARAAAAKVKEPNHTVEVSAMNEDTAEFVHTYTKAEALADDNA